METKVLQSWDDFENIELKKLIQYRDNINAKSNLHNPDILVFRGHRCSSWRLQTTLERHTSKSPKDQYSMQGYFELIKKAWPEINSIPTGIPWEILDLPEYSNWYEHKNFLWSQGLLDYMVFLRHHEFPSPYLDWTKSTDVAAYFAFYDADPRVDESVAIFAFLDNTAGFKGMRLAESHIARVRLNSLLEERHKRQDSTYTYCSIENNEGEYYSSHETVVLQNRRFKFLQDVLWKFIIPSSEKDKVIKNLELKGINTSFLLPLEHNHQEREFFQNLFKDLGG